MRRSVIPFPAGRSSFTPRERQVLSALYEQPGTNKELGQALNLSPGTVKNHLAIISGKVGVSGRLQLLRWALTHPQEIERGVLRTSRSIMRPAA